MAVGGRHFGNGWPGTGGHPWAHPGPVPGGVAAFCWASTLAVSSFWAHPAALAAFPAAELAGMSAAQAVALKPGGLPLPPMALVTVDGGGGYWAPTPRRPDGDGDR